MSDTLVKVENVSKKFCRSLKRSLWYGMQDIGAELLGRSQSRNGPPPLRTDEFWAVQDINFELKRGDCLGLIGRNGAGKSTLLKMLNGLLKPDTGRIEMRGRIGALIELGTGFNPILTGRENIYINGSILGFSRKELDKKFEEIVTFSELEEFIDTPVKNYSSGMKVRLGFSVAVHLDPDILILDEVLAVGDGGFKIKSYNKMAEVMGRATVIFVSHSMPVISRVCNQVMLMNQGQIAFWGHDVGDGVERYMDLFEGEQARIEHNDKAQINDLKVYALNRQEWDEKIPIVHYLDDLVVEMIVTVKQEFESYYLLLQFTDKDMKIVSQFFTNQFNQDFENSGQPMKIRVDLPDCMLTNGEYALTIFVISPNHNTGKYKHLAVYRTYANFKVRGLDGMLYAPFHLRGSAQIV